MMLHVRSAFWIILGYEISQVRRNLLTWAALPCLLLIPPVMSVVFGGSIRVSGHPLADQLRQSYAVAAGLTLVHFLATLYALCLCQERLGSSYLRHNDVLVLTRSVGRFPFWLAKLAGIVLPALAYTSLGLLLVMEEIVRHGGKWAPGLLLAEIPYGLALLTLVAIYLAARNHFSNFLIFFGWLLALPVLYVGDLWHLYGGVLRDAGPRLGLLTVLPQLGGLHGLAMGWSHPAFWRPDSLYALLNCGLWFLGMTGLGLALFQRKRL